MANTFLPTAERVDYKMQGYFTYHVNDMFFIFKLKKKRGNYERRNGISIR